MFKNLLKVLCAKPIGLSFLLCMLTFNGWSKALIDADLKALLTPPSFEKLPDPAINAGLPTNMIIFLFNQSTQKKLIKSFANHISIKFQAFDSLPILVVSGVINASVINALINHPDVAQLSLLNSGFEELEVSEQSILLRPSSIYPTISNWWDQGFTGKGSVVGVLDSGIATEHPSLKGKQIYVRKEPGSGYENFKNGVRSAHGTGIACIYASMGSERFPQELGVAYGADKIVTGLSGDGINHQEDDVVQTISTLDWMLSRAPERPNIINYSMGHQTVSCDNCPTWSGLAKVIDYVINRYQILWVKSAGNNGYVESIGHSSMTVPADNYNGLTVSNMNTSVLNFSHFYPFPNRCLHSIYHSSSRGPTRDGRKKPDLAAPGYNTWTCAPDPTDYPFQYTDAMNYHDGYRFMGGTSSATPHVGGAVLLLRQAGITNPIAQKALLINSADAWTDNNQPGPDDPNFPGQANHYSVMGSEWNKTYGWGYLNMQKAYEQRHYIKMDTLTLAQPKKVYEAHLPVGAKITVVHERRVGYQQTGQPWNLSHLNLEIFDKESHQLLFSDNSAIDTVHQAANCERGPGDAVCTNQTPIDVLITVSLVSAKIDGSHIEPFAISVSEPTKFIESDK